MSYVLPRPRIAAAAALSAAMLALPVAAEQQFLELGAPPAESDAFCDDADGGKNSLVTTSGPNAVAVDDYYEFEIIVGGIKDFSNIEYVDDADDLEIPELPVTYEDADS